MHSPIYNHCGYLDYALEPPKLRIAVRLAIKALKLLEFDAIAFRGMSGAMIAPILAMRMKKTLIMVRKDGVDNHSGMRVEGDKAARRYVIVDDFVSTGLTACDIMRKIDRWQPEAACIGVVQVRRLYTKWVDNREYKPTQEDMGSWFVYLTDYSLREAAESCNWYKRFVAIAVTSPTPSLASALAQNPAASAASL